MQAHVLSINGQPVNNAMGNMRKRTRQLPVMKAALATAKVPPVYVFNVGNRAWKDCVGGQKSFTIPACPKGKAHSEPLVIDGLFLSEYDLADGAMNVGVATDPGMSAMVEDRHFVGVANDIVGTDSTSAGFGMFTTNKEWFGVFVSPNAKPTDEELSQAHAKLRQMQQLIYAKGAEMVQQNEKVPMLDRKNYNEAAEYLGVASLWGNQDSILAHCPECQEPIKAEATYCKHCHQAIDPASVQARAAKREKANKEIAS